MSKTVRRKNGIGWSYGTHTIKDVLEEFNCNWIEGDDRYRYLITGYTHHDPKSDEGKRRIARFHSDASYHRNRRGPMWWIRMYHQRPYRRAADREIQKALNDDEYEAIIPDKPKRGYWD